MTARPVLEFENLDAKQKNGSCVVRMSRSLVRVLLIRQHAGGSALPVGLGLVEGLITDEASNRSAREVGSLEVNAAIPAGNARLIRRIRERRVSQSDVHGGNGSRFDARASRREYRREPERITSGEAPQYFGSRSAKRAVPGYEFRKWGGREIGRLIRNAE